METVHESGPGGTSITVRKSAFCEQHTPADSDAKPRYVFTVQIYVHIYFNLCKSSNSLFDLLTFIFIHEVISLSLNSTSVLIKTNSVNLF